MIDEDFLKGKLEELQRGHQEALQNAFRLEGAVSFCQFLLTADKEKEDGTKPNRSSDQELSDGIA